MFTEQATAWFGGLFGARRMTDKARQIARFKFRYLTPSIALLRGLTDPVVKLNMGQTAEVLAHRFGVSRESADRYALESHQRLARAHDEGWLDEMEPMIGDDGTVYDHDDGVRRDNSMEGLAKLKPAFERPFGKVTPGNSSQITDGAPWVILASEPAVKQHGLEPIARIVDSEWASLDPSVMGLGPVISATPILKRHKLTREDVGAWEINEAFAAQVLSCLAAWTDDRFCRDILGLKETFGALDREILNVDGGAISLGHPVGSSGNRITLHLVNALHRLGKDRGIATQCVGGGLGGALLVERV